MNYGNRRHREEEAEDQDWLTSHADLMTLLLGFFVILFSISHIDEGKLREVTQSFTAAFENPSEGTGTPASIQERSEQSLNAIFDIMNLNGSFDQKLRQLEKKMLTSDTQDENRKLLQKELETEVEIVKERRDLRIIIPEEILFESGKTKVKKEAKKKLQKIIGTVKPYLGPAVVIEVSGHTDGSTSSVSSRNSFLLSSLRAGSVAEFAIRSGVDKSNVRVNGMADLNPVIKEKGLRGRALQLARQKNRRVEIKVRFPR